MMKLIKMNYKILRIKKLMNKKIKKKMTIMKVKLLVKIHKQS